jgi:hypothetical protein
MPHLSVNQQTTSVNTDCPLPIADTYANAILRTLSSFKLPSPPISIHASRQHRHSYSHSKTVSQSVINEVSGLKTCIYRCSYICSSFSHSYFQVEVNGRSTSFFFYMLGLASYVIHTGRNDFSAFFEIEYLCMGPCSLFLLGMR